MGSANLKSRAKDLRQKMTDTERKLWAYLQDRRMEGLKFRRQQIIGPYIVDFVCFERRLIVECDGGQHHTEQKKYDQKRDKFLKSQDFRVLSFWNLDILKNLDGVYEEIQKALYE